MSLLLDTHALLWFVESDVKLSQAAAAAISEESGDVFLSIASVWEISIKYQLGSLKLASHPRDYLSRHMAQNRITLLPITLEHATAVADLPRYHGDPFDRLLVVQAQLLQLTVVSRDAVFDRYAVRRVW